MLAHFLKNKWFILLGFAASFVLLWFALARIDFSAVVASLRKLELWLLLVSMSFTVLGICFRALRWRSFFAEKKNNARTFFRLTNIGYFGNSVLPARAGELARILFLAKKYGEKLSVAVITAVADRLIDMATLSGLLLLLYYFMPQRFIPVGLAYFLPLAAVLVIAAYIWRKQCTQALKKLIHRVVQKWSLDAAQSMNELMSNFALYAKRRLYLHTLLLSALVLVTDYFSLRFLLQAFGLDLPWLAPIMLWASFSLGSALPSAPGYIGVYQVAAIWSLGYYAVDASTSVAVATLVQIITLFVTGFFAGPSCWRVFRTSLAGSAGPQR